MGGLCIDGAMLLFDPRCVEKRAMFLLAQLAWLSANRRTKGRKGVVI